MVLIKIKKKNIPIQSTNLHDTLWNQYYYMVLSSGKCRPMALLKCRYIYNGWKDVEFVWGYNYWQMVTLPNTICTSCHHTIFVVFYRCLFSPFKILIFFFFQSNWLYFGQHAQPTFIPDISTAIPRWLQYCKEQYIHHVITPSSL